MKLSTCYLEHLASLGLRHANRLQSWECGYKFRVFVNIKSHYPGIKLQHLEITLNTEGCDVNDSVLRFVHIIYNTTFLLNRSQRQRGSKAYVCVRSPAKTGFESHRGHGFFKNFLY
jgi:hypothetical protein